MRPSRFEILAAVLAEPGGITTRHLAEKLATVPHQIRPSLSKLAAYGQISKRVVSSRGDAVWGPIASPAISPELPALSCAATQPRCGQRCGADEAPLPGALCQRGYEEPVRLKKLPTVEGN